MYKVQGNNTLLGFKMTLVREKIAWQPSSKVKLTIVEILLIVLY